MRWWLAPLFCLAVGSAAAQPVETVVVYANALVGLWKIAWPESGSINLSGHAQWGPMRDQFCRIAQVGSDLRIHCFAGGLARDGTVSIDGAKLHFAFGNMLLRMFIDGTLQSATQFSGKQGVKFSGIEYDNPNASGGIKFTVPDTADKGGKAALLRTVLEELAKGPIQVPHDETAIQKNAADPSADVHALGAIQEIAYVGQAPKFGGTSDLDFFSVYAVEFDSGERICGLHQRTDGVLDAFLCL